jgi:mannosyl-3-phosphoglycerate phosphatase
MVIVPAMPPLIPLVVFTDLDGTLLDPATLSADAAAGALVALERRDIPLVFCSSRTRAEILLVQRELHVRHPFIAENGGAVFIPEGYFPFEVPGGRLEPSGYIVVQYGQSYSEVVTALAAAARRARVPVVGFNEMSVEDVAQICGVSMLSARLAKLREYSEPFRTVAGEPGMLRLLRHALNAQGFGCLAGSSFDLAGFHRDQGLAVRMLIALYRRALGLVRTVGLGDAFDDLPLLHRVDLPVIVAAGSDASSRQLLASLPRAELTKAPGSAGWAEHVLQIVARATIQDLNPIAGIE